MAMIMTSTDGMMRSQRAFLDRDGDGGEDGKEGESLSLILST